MNSAFHLKWFYPASIVIISLVFFVMTSERCLANSVRDNDVASAHLVVQLGHGSAINSAVLSVDDQLVLTASDDGTARLWETTTGRELRRFEGHGDWVKSATFSPDGQSVLTASNDGTARLWETSTARELRRFEGQGRIISAVFSPDSRFVLTVSSVDKFAELLQKKALQSLADDESEADDEFENDVDEALVDVNVQLWDAATGRELRQFKFTGHRYFPGGTAVFSPDSRSVLTVAHNGTASLWEIKTGRKLLQLGGHSNQTSFDKRPLATSAVFSPDGRAVLIVGAGSARLWDIDNGRELRRFGGCNDQNPSTLPPIIVTSAVFSADGRTVLTSGWDMASAYSGAPAARSQSGEPLINMTICLWETTTGQKLKRFGRQSDRATGSMFSSASLRAIFSPDNRAVLTTSIDGPRLWEIATGRELQRFGEPNDQTTTAVFSADGHTILTANHNRTARLWERATGRELRRFEGQGAEDKPAQFSDSDGRAVDPSIISILEEGLAAGLRRFVGQGGGITSAIFSIDGRNILTGSNDGTARLWDTSTGQEVRRFVRQSGGINSAVFSPDRNMILTSSLDGAHLWEMTTGRELRSFRGSGVTTATFSTDGRVILTSSWDKTARLWETVTGRELGGFKGHGSWITSAAFSPDSSTVLTASWDQTARLWETTTGRELQRFEGHGDKVASAVFSPDGSKILTASADKTARLWDVATGRERRRFEAHGDKVASAVFSPDGSKILTASADKTARLWDVATGREIQRFSGSGGLNSATFSPDGRFVITASIDRTTHIWNSATGEELARLVSLDSKTWVVTTPDGRFDTNNLEDIKGLHWVMSDDPMRSLPIEIFMRDYYEPRLLPRLLAGEKLPEIPSVALLNRVQPKIKINRVWIEDEKDGLVAITIEVGNSTSDIKRADKQAEMQSGVYDLRLFRNRQLVAQFPEPAERGRYGEKNREEELVEWRNDHEIKLDQGTGKKTITFRGIRLPRNTDLKEIEFSAYAFNVDRVKSTTARITLDIPKKLTSRQSRAYVVAVGVNGFERNAMNRLSYAANDANGLSTELSSRLKDVKHPETGRLLFGDANVIPITLITDFGTGDQKDKFVINNGTKGRIKAVIEKLAGKLVKDDQLMGVVNADQLHPARPEDLLVLAFSTHGDTDRYGQFYLMPHDLGMSKDERDIRKNAISSEELSEWLRTLDAGELVMIVDACHSAATVESKEFKPGPMGSRGLGQLAFDKGMRILAASQRDQYALETEKTQQGLLSYALVREGLKDSAADFKPRDTLIQLSEWLSYGAERVPSLYQDYRNGKLKARAAAPLDRPEGKNFISIQQPALFDFARGRDTFIQTTNR